MRLLLPWAMRVLFMVAVAPVSAQRQDPNLGFVTEIHPRCNYFVINSTDYFLLQWVGGVRPELFDWTRDTLDYFSVGSASIEVIGKGTAQVGVERSYGSSGSAQEALARRCGFDSYEAYFSDLVRTGPQA